MKRFCIIKALILAFCTTGLPLAAQDSGMLPNGTAWYLISDTSRKGRADFALVQKNRQDVEASRRALRKLQNFQEEPPYMFLCRKGVGFGQNGLISYPGTSTVFEFRDVPSFDEAAADSTLLILFDIMRECPAEQAVIVCGDISVPKLADRIQMLSLTVPRRQKTEKGKHTAATAADSCRIELKATRRQRAVTICAEYISPRVPAEKFNTPLTSVTGKLSLTLSELMRRRLERAYRKEGIACCGISCPYAGSLDSPFNERHAFSVTVDRKDSRKALEILSGELSSLDRFGTDMVEFTEVEVPWPSDTRTPLQRCVWNYLYGLPLNTVKSGDITRKRLPVETRKALFDKFCSAILDSSDGLRLTMELPEGYTPDFDPGVLFKKAWTDPDSLKFLSHAADSARFDMPNARVRLKSASQDKISGGKMWIFSNGTRVVYRETDNPGKRFTFSVLLKGGYSGIPDIKAGQSAFLGDMFSLRKVAGLGAEEFHETLQSHGIRMRAGSDISGLRINGSAPVSKLQLTLLSLLSCAKNSAPDKEAFKYYLECEKIAEDVRRYSDQGLWDLLYSHLHKGYLFPEIKRCDVADTLFQEAAEKYFTARFARFNDAIIVLEGHFDEAALQKTLCKTIGAFPVSKQTAAPRQKADDRISGIWYSSYRKASEAPAGDGKVALAMSIAAETPVGMNSTVDFLVACQYIKEALTGALVQYGLRAELHPDVELYPRERFVLNILCLPVMQNGLPQGISPAGGKKTMEVLRRFILTIDASRIDEVWLNGVKNNMESSLKADINSPGGAHKYAAARYLFGKDFASGCSDAIGNCSRESVARIVDALKGGSRIEYSLQ